MRNSSSLVYMPSSISIRVAPSSAYIYSIHVQTSFVDPQHNSPNITCIIEWIQQVVAATYVPKDIFVWLRFLYVVRCGGGGAGGPAISRCTLVLRWFGAPRYGENIICRVASVRRSAGQSLVVVVVAHISIVNIFFLSRCVCLLLNNCNNGEWPPLIFVCAAMQFHVKNIIIPSSS